MRRMIRNAAAGVVVVLLVGACGDDASEPGAATQPEDPADPDPAEPDLDELDLDDLDLDDLDEALDDMRSQLEELGEEAEEFELDPVEQDPDRALLLPADVAVTGDLQGSYTQTPGCDVRAQFVDFDDVFHEDVLEVRFGWAGHTFDWTVGPDDPRDVVATLHVPDFTGGGSYEAIVMLGRVDVVATGTAQFTIVENRREEFPTGEIVVIEGSFDGTWSGSAGTGAIAGDLGVCNVRVP